MANSVIEHSNAQMHAIVDSVRTTVEISDRVYTQIRALAAARGQRGFSPIVEAALRDYLARQEDRPSTEAFENARGSWTDEDATRFSASLQEAWASWTHGR
ncbi:MAG: ribbon-helix-helix protein, CopG family [Solirubrobacterales bacterium]|nr:ribbon-helix-helix protein, CopG family [Solirubrobacterales bacterium]